MARKKEVEKTQLKKGAAEFTLIGKAQIGKYTFSMEQNSKTSDWVYNRLNLGVDCGEGNVVYAELMGGYGATRDNVVYVHGKKLREGSKDKYKDDYDNKFTIDWDNRFEEKIFSEIGNGCFVRAGIEKDADGKNFTKRFLSGYDFIKYIEENKELLKDAVIRVSGKIVYSIYNGNTQVKKEITSIYLSNATEEEFGATFKQSILIDKYSLGKKDKETNLYDLDVKVIDYTKNYNGEEVKTSIPFSRTLLVENEKLLKLFKVKKDITQITVIGNIIEGQAKAVVEYDDLDDDIKELIDMGAYTLEDVAKTMSVKGDRVNQWIVTKPDIKMVGEEDAKVPQIQREEQKYVEDDLFFDFMIENVDDDDEEDEIVESVDADDDELDDFLNDL